MLNQPHQLQEVLAFSSKYDCQHAQRYYEKHETEFWRKLSNWRDHQIARRALQLAGNPASVLDAPCGTGRFWGVLAEDPNPEIHVSDYNQTMLDVGMAKRPETVISRCNHFKRLHLICLSQMVLLIAFFVCVLCIT